MNELDEILETEFSNREVNRVTAMIEVLEDIEHDKIACKLKYAAPSLN